MWAHNVNNNTNMLTLEWHICTFQVYVNGKKYYLFKHRMPVEKVNTLHIYGDVNMNIISTVPVSYTVYSSSSIMCVSVCVLFFALFFKKKLS